MCKIPLLSDFPLKSYLWNTLLRGWWPKSRKMKKMKLVQPIKCVWKEDIVILLILRPASRRNLTLPTLRLSRSCLLHIRGPIINLSRFRFLCWSDLVEALWTRVRPETAVSASFHLRPTRCFTMQYPQYDTSFQSFCM